jgi:hypothetical protein
VEGIRMTEERRADAAIPHADGAPPYRVKWLGDDRESVVVPPPEAVLSCRTPAGSSVDRKE